MTLTSLSLPLPDGIPRSYRRVLGVIRHAFSEQMTFHTAGFRNPWQSWGAHLALSTVSPDALQERRVLAGDAPGLLAPDRDRDALYARHGTGLRDSRGTLPPPPLP